MSEQQPLLSDEFRRVTKDVHDISDKLVNMKLLIAFTDRRLYGQAIQLFYYIYAQLELALERNQNSNEFNELKKFFPILARSSAFVKDIEYYVGKDWEKEHPKTKAVEEYITHLEELEKENVLLLVPYFYHLYLAILAGGQMIKKMAIKAMSLPKGEGVAIFDINVPNRLKLRNEMKAAVNALSLNDLSRDRLLVESVNVFKMNNKVVGSLHGSTQRFAYLVAKWGGGILIIILAFCYVIRMLDLI